MTRTLLALPIGTVFDRWTTTTMPFRGKQRGRGVTLCVCRCQCGTVKTVLVGKLKNKGSRSCGCLLTEALTTNGGFYSSHRRLSRIYCNMVSRCHSTHDPNFRLYGARGIVVCTEWRNSLKCFVEWSLANGYDSGLEIDRLKNSLGYCPTNCRWVTKTTNNRNKRTNRLITAYGETKTLAEWSELSGVPAATIRKRIVVAKWSPEKAIPMKLQQGSNAHATV